jgi:hypothetical protein
MQQNINYDFFKVSSRATKGILRAWNLTHILPLALNSVPFTRSQFLPCKNDKFNFVYPNTKREIFFRLNQIVPNLQLQLQ